MSLTITIQSWIVIPTGTVTVVERSDPGRPRDADIDRRVLAATRHHLAQRGYEALSVAAVAAAAGTTRQAVYRRWPTKADLATAAVADLSRAEERVPTDDPAADLVRELEAFRAGISRPDGLSMVGTMLQDSTDPELVAHFRERIVTPRRTRLRAILERAVAAAGTTVDPVDLDVAVATLTGSWYAHALAGEPPPPDWAARLTRHTLAGLGA